MPHDVASAQLVRATGTDPEPLQPLARPVPAPRLGHDLGFDGHPWFPLAIGTLTAAHTTLAPLGDRGPPWREAQVGESGTQVGEELRRQREVRVGRSGLVG
jgi:hypothetical protein